MSKARVQGKNVLQINAKHVQARYLLAQINEHDQEWQKMFGNLKLTVTVANDPDFHPARLALTELYIANIHVGQSEDGG